MMKIKQRLAALENATPTGMPLWHCIRRYDDETDEQAVAAYEAENGPIVVGNVTMRVVISKPGERPKCRT